MENHPIPQDVTGFKFKLIGSITVKQFLYLLGFGILTTVAFVLPINILIKAPTMAAFALVGVALAFVPIEGRPMDVMLVNFAKAIPSENRYLYRKRGANLATFQVFGELPKKQGAPRQGGIAKVANPQDEKRAVLLSRLRNSPFRPDQSETRILDTINSYFTNGSSAVSTPPVLGSPMVVNQENTASELNKKRLDEIAKEAQRPPPVPKKEAGDAEFSMKETRHEIPKETTLPQPTPVRANPSLTGGFPTLPDVPNVVLGIIRDARGKTLPNILVEVIDSNGIPVRAFKTNALGQFASATQLQNGTYKIYFEDPQKNHEFEATEITLNGEIFNPLETTSIDAREKLRRELFGGVQATA
ncbi:MAG: hypothetical protein A3C30_03835 [Candidatus Levybacteria bacterium RIFCSPHIGHO2_02_FULL_40_18]|nr:MAG: hypothetical protein A2869_00455 [Candidatus Levybacteria bacterium RIFCSPHIGHO2_01_FULL_40_58]OGH26216.1 MAG: hypothetical protein A3C30_03835 [Candidatus Levybacteria bacterium RIFCSPHIGHO2_02_FULL_40_18]OGH31468.1 MAG: hypothetical protein A3E43_02875 [Candidatus Levybacteria bacterium RIFCSPHIGHO2_12_FULL_40_31]OGH40108.1 MAG: hypothetical protein A2894_04195 [Candidatus Levybacteria bacterium RIFCSPLOWO2_01_FULL_40_64]